VDNDGGTGFLEESLKMKQDEQENQDSEGRRMVEFITIDERQQREILNILFILLQKTSPTIGRP
jgi:c-di-GMP-binding flagellar brake protein YcgR